MSDLEQLSQLLAKHMRTKPVRVSKKLSTERNPEVLSLVFPEIREFNGTRRPEPLMPAESTFLGLISDPTFEEFYRNRQFSAIGATITRDDTGATSFTVSFAGETKKEFKPHDFINEMNVFRRDKGLEKLRPSAALQKEVERQAELIKTENIPYADLPRVINCGTRTDLMFIMFGLGDIEMPILTRCVLVPEFKTCLEWPLARNVAVSSMIYNGEDAVLLLVGK